MHNLSPIKTYLTLFPISLVIFEFTVYIANDMVQPAMPKIIENFNADIKWIPSSLTAYLAGGIFLEWLFGPLSDQYGRRPIMLIGIFLFSIACLLTTLTTNIEQFIILRFFQGTGLCFISSIGYTTIQEYFDKIHCLKIITTMTNITLIAPLLGPLVGAILINIFPWEGMFIILFILSSISFISLWLFMPETIKIKNKNISISSIWENYKQIFTNTYFLYGALAIGFSSIPLLTWIALSPIILIKEEKLSPLIYALLQIPIFSGLILGNTKLGHIIGKIESLEIIKISIKPTLTGLLLAIISTILHLPKSYIWTTIGLSIYAFGLGISNACLTRLTLFSSKISKGTVSAAMGILSMIMSITGIEFSNIIYCSFGKLWIFNSINLVEGICWLILIKIFINQKKHQKEKNI